MSSRLPSSIDDLVGRKAARWIRESRPDQYDRYGPDSQREIQDQFVERYSLVDTQLVYPVAHSGITVWQTPEMQQMLEAAGRYFDVLLTGYYDRWQRNLRRTLELVEDRLHPSGAAWVMCDRRLVSSNRADYREMKRLAQDAEEYSERLSERIGDGYAAKWRRFTDPAGSPPVGFRRHPETKLMAVDHDAIARVVQMFEWYATGAYSIREVAASFGVNHEALRATLRNSLYNGWVAYKGGASRPAAWRSDPPVPDDLWQRVAAVREQHQRGGGPRPVKRVDPLKQLVYCADCGTYIRANGTGGWKGSVRNRRLHVNPCSGWGPTASTLSDPIQHVVAEQLASIRLDETTISKVVSALGSEGRPAIVDIGAHRAKRERQALMRAYEDGRISVDDLIARDAALRTDVEQIEPRVKSITPERAVRWLHDMRGLISKATPELLSELTHTVFDRIDVRGSTVVSVTLSGTALRHGLGVAMPQSFRCVLARPAGFEPAT